MALKWYKLDSVAWRPADSNGLYHVGFAQIQGRKFCLIKKGNSFYGVQNNCPHAGGNLSSGWIENDKLVCPVHRHTFDLITGRGSVDQGDCVRTYNLKSINDQIYIELPLSMINPLNWFKLL
ncbi:Rieske (2Fe-2S) protein [Solitalea lacus]|uniref:Rieske (2Fe-2S) protein n=1 Tax=Solitalea lacus TaxID=2911172 RepID=UPI001ED9FA47|nr:Rieske 2Fe-2S domain-containing protein [Solitalea lacus]UKJ05934.1 Rieske 2Fe-2S domain-containing protein [Solitalea lacus]